jgi:hypothetical protein
MLECVWMGKTVLSMPVDLEGGMGSSVALWRNIRRLCYVVIKIWSNYSKIGVKLESTAAIL